MSAAGTDRACDRCLGRALLLRELAPWIERAVDRGRGSRARDLLALGGGELAQAVAGDRAPELVARARGPAAVARLRERLGTAGCWSRCRHGTLPEALGACGAAAPRALFGRGDPGFVLGLEPDAAVTIVGSRRAGPYGREIARELGRLLASSGIAVVSGMALGVDSAAHEGALAAGEPTLAVLGSGADRAYPRARARLYGRIVEEGAVISELPPGTPTFRWMFPARNRLMAALTGLTIVVEAAERSGSLITAEMALESGRAVGAVPGPVNSWRSEGANRLLAEGAAVIRDAQDALDQLLGPGRACARRMGPPLDRKAVSVLLAVEGGADGPDAVARECGLPAPEAAAALALLELGGYVRCDAAGRYARTGLAVPAA